MVPISAFPQTLQTEAEEKFDALNRTIKAAGFNPPSQPAILRALPSVLVYSNFIYDSCRHNPELLPDLTDSGDLLRAYQSNEYFEKLAAVVKPVGDATQLQAVLRGFRRREMVRLAWRDLTGEADLNQMMQELSAFADACIDQSLTWLYDTLAAEFGAPANKAGIEQQLVVIGMGKLGGCELNFSSDIDLLFAYPQNGQTTGTSKSVSNEEFFARLCRKLLQILGKVTADGIVFRVDMRLRPFGDNGPLAMSFDATESYYQMQGREWERYALIKARCVAGDKASGARLLKRLNPFVYRRYLDYGAFESLREMKQKISLEVRRKEMQQDIKLGPGGIREIEFFGQVFQLIRGGVNQLLQERRILSILDVLQRAHFIPMQVAQDLRLGYVFLRTLEHRLQEFADQQTHRLPSNPTAAVRLALSMGYPDVETFQADLDQHRRRVHQHFTQLLASEAKDSRLENTLKGIWQGLVDPPQAQREIETLGYAQAQEVLVRLHQLREDLSAQRLSAEALKRLDKLIPMLLEGSHRSPDPLMTLKRLFDLIRAIGGRASYLALLIENPESLVHLVELTSASSLIATFLARHPVLLDELLDPRTLYAPPDRAELEQELRNRIDRLTEDLEYQMDEFRVFRQINMLRVAAADVARALPLMRVSDHLSDLAETIVNEALEVAWHYLIQKHGQPECQLNGVNCEKGFVVIAYGKLGGLELGYGSDLDLVFLHSGLQPTTPGKTGSIDSSLFFARLGQRVIHMLTAHTSAGIVYETDMRLRPSGSSGVLVSHIEGFRDYQFNDAWTWEHQALIRSRAIGGDRLLCERFEQIRTEVLTRPREPEALRQEVSDMRKRMRNELLKPTAGRFHLKQGIGGMVDIEFLVQYLVLLHANRHPGLVRWTDNVRLLQSLAEHGIISGNTAHLLRHAYLIYRADAHRLSLQEKKARVPATKYDHLSQRVASIWDSYLGS